MVKWKFKEVEWDDLVLVRLDRFVCVVQENTSWGSYMDDEVQMQNAIRVAVASRNAIHSSCLLYDDI